MACPLLRAAINSRVRRRFTHITAYISLCRQKHSSCLATVLKVMLLLLPSYYALVI